MTALSSLLDSYRQAAVTEREKGTYFEELIRTYLRNEATYKDLYSDVWTYADWAKAQGLDKRDAGIDLVARTHGTNEIHAIQCKLYADSYRVQKSDIDSFFTASGKKPFTHRVIVATTSDWSTHAENALQDQQTPVSKIDINDLEASQIDWAKYQAKAAPVLKPKKSLFPHQQSALAAASAGLKDGECGRRNKALVAQPLGGYLADGHKVVPQLLHGSPASAGGSARTQENTNVLQAQQGRQMRLQRDLVFQFRVPPICDQRHDASPLVAGPATHRGARPALQIPISREVSGQFSPFPD